MKRFIFYVEATTFVGDLIEEQKFHGFLECEDEAEARQEISIWAGDVMDIKRLELSEMKPKQWFHSAEIQKL